MWNPVNRIDESGTALAELNFLLPNLVPPIPLLEDNFFEK